MKQDPGCYQVRKDDVRLCTIFTRACTKVKPRFSARSQCMVAVYLKHLCSISFIRSTPAMELTLERTFVQTALLLVFLFHDLHGFGLSVRAATRQPALVKCKPYEENECREECRDGNSNSNREGRYGDARKVAFGCVAFA